MSMMGFVLLRILESTHTYNAQQEQHMVTIKEVANIARRMSNAVDSTTATISTESSKIRDDFARTADLLEMSEFVSEEAMTKCIGMLEDRIKHALRIFTDVLKTSGGRSAAQAFHAQLRRDASLSPGLGSTGASRKSLVAGTLFGTTNDSVAVTAMPTIDVDRMLMESGMVEFPDSFGSREVVCAVTPGMRGLQGPSLPKTDSPLGSTKMPNFSKSAFLEGEEEALPDERSVCGARKPRPTGVSCSAVSSGPWPVKNCSGLRNKRLEMRKGCSRWILDHMVKSAEVATRNWLRSLRTFPLDVLQMLV
jgi:hypothetical protein